MKRLTEEEIAICHDLDTGHLTCTECSSQVDLCVCTDHNRPEFPFNEGDDYWTIENGEVIWSCWDDVSEELHKWDNRYFRTEADATLFKLYQEYIW